MKAISGFELTDQTKNVSDPSQLKMTKQPFLTDFFFNYKFLCVKTVANTNKKIWWGHIDWKLKLKKNEPFLLISLWLFKLCDKMQLTFCVANITMPTSFHQCLGVKPCSEKKFCQNFPYKICFSAVWKLWLKVQLLSPSMELTLSQRGGLCTKKFQPEFVNKKSSTEHHS